MIERDMQVTETPPRRVVGSFTNYAEAQQAVDALADRNFPVDNLAIVGEGIRLVEQVTGRVDTKRAALGGVVSGAVTGLFFGYLIGLFNLAAPLISAINLALYGLIVGAIIGAVLGVLFHRMSGGERDFRSVSGIEAERYNVMANEPVAERARLELGESRTTSSAHRPN